MSNRAFAVVVSILLIALGIMIAVSLLLGRLSLSPLSLGLLAFLIVIPAGYFLRTLPMILMGNTLADQMRERIKVRRIPMTPVATRLCAASLVSAYAVIAAVSLGGSDSPNSFWFGTPLLVAAWLFLFGALGLIYSSAWVQRHAVALAFAGIPVVLCGLASFVLVPLMSSRFFIVPLAVTFSGVYLICVPIQVSFLRSWGQID